MGFYGNIANTSKTTFTFDKIYSSRFDMENNSKIDNVFIGRYVLVEYDSNVSKNVAYRAYMKPGDFGGALYSTSECKEDQILKYGEDALFEDGSIYNIALGTTVYVEDVITGSRTFFTVLNVKPVGQPAIFTKIENGSSSDANFYATNYEVDRAWAKEMGVPFGRGWDSTVWQKTFANGKEKYVMIAELNSVVPTFDLSVDAPTVMPTAPHFDEQSTNVYYKLHTQPSWGFRLAGLSNKFKGPAMTPDNADFGASERVTFKINDEEFIAYRTAEANKISYGKSDSNITNDCDERIILTKDLFDKESNSIKTYYYDDEDEFTWSTCPYKLTPVYILSNLTGYDKTQLAAQGKSQYIVPYERNTYYYINDEGDYILDALAFATEDRQYYMKENRGYNAAIFYNKKGFSKEFISHIDNINDRIELVPSGKSGMQYNKHDGTNTTEPMEDTQELNLILPAIGNTVASMWDLMFGGIDVSDTSSPTQPPKRYLNYSWEDVKKLDRSTGLRLVETRYLGPTEKLDARNSLETKHADSLAGSINTAHDLIGMIITEEFPKNNEEIKTAYDKYIYYNDDDGGFYRKKLDYNYTELPYMFKIIDLNESTYIKGYYYLAKKDLPNEYSADDFEVCQENTFDVTKTYYGKFSSDKNLNYLPVDNLIQYIPGYYRKVGTNWIYDTCESPSENTTYYSHIEAKQKDLTTSYAPGVYYYKDDQKLNYLLSKEESAREGTDYFTIDLSTIKKKNNYLLDPQMYDTENDNYLTGEIDEDTGLPVAQELVYFYAPGIFSKENNPFWIKTIGDRTSEDEEAYQQALTEIEENHNKGNYYATEEDYEKAIAAVEQKYKKMVNWNYVIDQDIDPDETYYLAYAEITTSSDWEETDTGLSQGVTTTKVVIDESQVYKIKLISIDDPDNEYYFKDNTTGDYIKVTNDTLKNYYKDFNFFCDPELPTVEKFDIYTIKAEPQGLFYTANKYYVKHDQSYILSDVSMPFNDNIPYYEIIDDQCVKVENGFYRPGKFFYESTVDNFILDYSKQITEGRQYYKKNDFYVISDLEQIFYPGSMWNKDLDIIPATVKLGTKEEIYVMQELIGFARELNTLNGLLLRINEVMEFNDLNTRDRTTVAGTINTLNDIIDRFDRLKPREFVIVDDYGRAHSATYSDDEWINININGNPTEPEVTVYHTGPVTTPAQNQSNKTPAFNETFTIEDWSFDKKGHKANRSTHTVRIPGLELVKDINSDDDVVTSITYAYDTTNKKGVFTETREQVGTLPITSYVEQASAKLTNTDSINTAFGKLQGQINAMDYSDPNAVNTTFVSKVTEADGIITVERHNAGDLVMTGYTIAAAAADVAATDSLNTALGKLAKNIKQETADRQSVIEALDVNALTDITGKVLTNISETDGKISATNATLGSIQLGTYTAPTGGNGIGTTSTLANALSTLDARIYTEEQARKGLNKTDNADATQIISTITQSEGQIAFSRAAAGTLLVAGTSTASGHTNQESLNSLKDKIDLLNADSSTTGSIKEQINTAVVNLIDGAEDSFDTLKEIANWINDSDENEDGFNAAQRIQNLENTLNTANTGLVARVTAIEGKDCIDITNTQIQNWNTAYNNNHEHSNKAILETISQDDLNNWNAAEPNDENTVLTTTEFDYTFEDSTISMTIAGLMTKIAELEERIKTLETPSTPEPDEPIEDPEGEITPEPEEPIEKGNE